MGLSVQGTLRFSHWPVGGRLHGFVPHVTSRPPPRRGHGELDSNVDDWEEGDHRSSSSRRDHSPWQSGVIREHGKPGRGAGGVRLVFLPAPLCLREKVVSEAQFPGPSISHILACEPWGL